MLILLLCLMTLLSPQQIRSARIDKLIASGTFTAEQMAWVLEHGSDADQRRLQLMLEHPYYCWEPRPDNPEVFENQTAFVNDNTSSLAICLGGTGSGKTDAAAYKTARYVLETPPPREACPFWIVAASFEQVGGICWGEKLSRFIPEDAICPNGIRWQDSKAQHPRFVQLKHPTKPGAVGWILEFKAYAQQIISMTGRSIGGYWCNEEVPFDFVQEIKGRCRDYNSPGWCDFTPITCKDPRWPKAYLKPPKKWTFYHLHTMHNPYVDQEWKDEFYATVPEDLWDLRTIGKFSATVGQVFKEYRYDIHVVEPFAIPRTWKKIRAIDFGFNNAFVCLWIAEDSDGNYYVYDEYFRNQRPYDQHADEIRNKGYTIRWKDAATGAWDTWKSRTWTHNCKDGDEIYFGQTYSDNDPQCRVELERRGINCTPAAKGPGSINPGVEYLRSLIVPHAATGRPRLFFFGKKNASDPDNSEVCSNLIREVGAYHYAEGTESRSPNEEPVKVDDHAIDAMRYALVSVRTSTCDWRPSSMRYQPDGSKYGLGWRGR